MRALKYALVALAYLTATAIPVAVLIWMGCRAGICLIP